MRNIKISDHSSITLSPALPEEAGRTVLFCLYPHIIWARSYPNIAIKIPAMTAEPTVLATIGPIACISRWLCGLYRRAIFWDTRAAIGIADTPALPISGFTFPLVALFIILAINTCLLYTSRCV